MRKTLEAKITQEVVAETIARRPAAGGAIAVLRDAVELQRGYLSLPRRIEGVEELSGL
jgi:hypothetical protein